MRFTTPSLLCFLSLLVRCQKTSCADVGNSSSTRGGTGKQTWPPAWTQRGCNICTCNYDSKKVDCSDRNFSSGLPPAAMFPVKDALAFFFGNSSVSHINSGYFLDFFKVEIISGERNQLTRPFSVPTSIVGLGLADNGISSVFGFFQRPLSDYKFLEHIDFSENCLRQLNKDDLSGFPRLQTLFLDSMKESLLLENGAISNLPMLLKLSLDRTQLTNTSILTLDALGLKSQELTVTNDYNNKLQELGEDLLLLPSVTKLSLSNCKIKRIHRNAFRHLRSLQDLSLSLNEIEYLPAGLLQNAHMFMSRVELSGNYLTSLSGSPFREGQTVIELYLSNNSLTDIDESLFETVTSVTFLDLAMNRLTRLPASLSRQRIITSLFLFGNYLEKLEKKSFSGLQFLNELHLMRNRIVQIEEGTFQSLTSAKKIYLVDNNLTSLPSDLFVPLRNCTVWLNCFQLTTFPQIPKDLDLQCVTTGHGVDVIFLDGSLGRLLMNMGFVCVRVNNFQFLYNCSECPSGTISPVSVHHELSLDQCRNCPAGGWYQDEAGQTSCKKCVKGTYVHPGKSPGKSPLDCTVCPTGTDSEADAGYRACPCLKGFYRLDRFGPCMACNATSPGLECNDEYPAVKSGYWWTWGTLNSSQVQQQFVNFTRELQIPNDTYHSTSMRFRESLPIVYRCPNPDGCRGGVTDEEMCEDGHTGPLCSLCDSKHLAYFSTCQRCPPLWRRVLQLFLVLFLIALLMFALYKADKLRMTRSSRRGTVVDQIASKAKILVGFAQVMAGVLSSLAYVPWPPLLLHAGSWLKKVELNVVEMANPSCFTSHLRINELETTVINMIGQVFLLLSIFVYYHLRYSILPCCQPRFRPDMRSLSLARRSCLRNSWWILFLCYPSTTAHILATMPYKNWTCMKLCHYDGHQDCPWYLKADLSVQCNYDGANRDLFLICWSMSVYVVLLPLLLLWGLFKRHRTPTQTEHDTGFLFQRRRRYGARQDLLTSLEFLDENYEAKFWYWELMEIARKFLLTCGIEYFGSTSLSGVAVAALIANVFLLLHAQFKPIKRKSDHWLQLLSLLVISLSLMLGTLIALEQATYEDNLGASSDRHDRQVFSIIVLLVNGLFILYLFGRIVFVVYCSVKKVRARKEVCRVALFFIYLFTDDNSDDSYSVGSEVGVQDESVLGSLAAEGNSCDE